MKITLRKANALQNSINDAIRGIELKTEVSINEFENPAKVINEAQVTFGVNLGRTLGLLRTVYEIRMKVGEANRLANVDRDLTAIAWLDRETAIYESLAGSAVMLDEAVIAGQLDKIKNAGSDSRIALYGRDTVNTSVLNKEQVVEFRDLVQKNKRKKQNLQDDILEMNVKTEIDLSDEAVKVLQREGLL